MKSYWERIKDEWRKASKHQEKVISMRREKAETLMHLTDTLESLTGNRDINEPLRMAIRLMAVGVDPKDNETIGRIAEAYAMGKYEFVPVNEKEFQSTLKQLNDTAEEMEKKS